LRECGFEPNPPAGAYYIMAGIEALTDLDDVAFADHLIRTAGVATVPGSSFYANRELGRRHVRFSFPKRTETIERGIQALRRLA
ncbi:MAG: aminotransferase class I/II-fold pyridoxal phosphate-dependent enzyme, partial [Acidimicrobiaceae bacterium]|nr:aminotransferase class I/II-fold pyridoxal phosphate-dependent enzyme [Acidimicrobiaceae bacterium]